MVGQSKFLESKGGRDGKYVAENKISDGNVHSSIGVDRRKGGTNRTSKNAGC